MSFRAVIASLLATGLLAVFAALHAEKPSATAEPPLIFTATQHYDPTAWLKGGERFPDGAKLTIRQNGNSRLLVPDFFASADPSISFDGTHVLFAGKMSRSDPWQIWEVSIGGGDPKRIGSCVGCVRPFYLPDNRIVYARKVDGRFQLFAVSIAGGEPLQLSYSPGDALPTDVLSDGRILFEAGYPLGAGEKSDLYTVYPDGSGVESYRCDHGSSRHSGKQLRSGDVVFAKDNGAARFTSALAHDVAVLNADGEFGGDVVETASDKWIGPWRANADSHYALEVWKAQSGTHQTLVADAVQPQIVRPQPVPNRFPSALHEWGGANVLCLNAYTSKLRFEAGSIKTVNLYTQENGKSVLLGAAQVEADGSFFLHVPSDQPLQIELLDASGKTLQREHGWFWMRRGEQRECVGCHAGPERSPENAVPMALIKSTDPADLTAKSPNAKGGR
jgi:hypothetical protein